MAVPNIFANVTTSIPLSQLDTNFATAITLGNTAVYLGNTTTTIGNLTLTNANVSSVSTPITPAQGGTGLATLTANNVLIGNGTSNVTFVAPGTSGNALISNGTVWASSAVPAGSAATPTALGTVYGKMDNASPYNTSTGYQAGASTTAGSNVFMGYQAGYTNVSGSNITAVGFQAGYSYNGSSTQYTFIGDRAGYSTVSGAGGITAVGAMALYTNTTGSANTAVGGYDTISSTQSALKLNTTGSYNTAVGNGSLSANTIGASNTAMGWKALLALTGDNSNNTAVGDRAGYQLTGGAWNTCIGAQAGQVLTGGNFSTLIGYKTQPSASSDTDFLVIGSGYSPNSGNGAVGKGSNTGYIQGGNGGIYQGNNSSSWSTTSDRRLKKNIVDNTEGLNKISQIRVRNFEYRLPEEVDPELKPTDAVQKEGVQLGVIAQELQEICPDCVKTESTGVISVDSDNIFWHMVNAIKDLKAINDTQAETITALTARIVALESK